MSLQHYRDCPFEYNIRGELFCPQCGYVYPIPVEQTPHRNCPKAKSRGFGDTIAKWTRKLGIRPCGGCKKRQRWFNKHFPYRTGQS